MFAHGRSDVALRPSGLQSGYPPSKGVRLDPQDSTCHNRPNRRPPDTTRARLPRQIAYIIGNEGCERFSFYGMRNILTQFLVSSALLFSATELVSQGGARGGGQGSLPHLRPGRLLLPAPRRLARGPVPGQVPDHPLPQPGLLRRPGLPGPVRGRQGRLLPRAVPDRAGVGRDQALRLGVRGRPVRPVEQVARQDRLRRLLLDHQLRLLLRVPADAGLPPALRPVGRVRHPRGADVRFDRDPLAGPPALRRRAAGAAAPGLVRCGSSGARWSRPGRPARAGRAFCSRSSAVSWRWRAWPWGSSIWAGCC